MPPAERATGPASWRRQARRRSVGIDFDDGNRCSCPLRATQARTSFRATCDELPFEDGAFDLVVSFETIEHVRRSRGGAGRAWSGAGRGGLLLISTPNKHSTSSRTSSTSASSRTRSSSSCCRTRFPNVELLLQHNWLASTVSCRRRGARGVGGTDNAGRPFRQAQRASSRAGALHGGPVREAARLHPCAPWWSLPARRGTRARAVGSSTPSRPPRSGTASIEAAKDVAARLARQYEHRAASDRRLRLRLVAHDGTAALAGGPHQAT